MFFCANCDKPIEIYKNIYWVGFFLHDKNLSFNSYLIVRNKMGILINPGGRIHYKHIVENIKKIIPVDALKYIIVPNKEVISSSALPMYERDGIDATLVGHSKTLRGLHYYGLKLKKYPVDKNNWRINEFYELVFKFTPHGNHYDAISLFDTESRIFFSGELFGLMTERWNLYASDNYMDLLKEVYKKKLGKTDSIIKILEAFPENVMEIAPQCGSIINNSLDTFIKELKIYRRDALDQNGALQNYEAEGYVEILNLILERLLNVYGKDRVKGVFENSKIFIDYSLKKILAHAYCTEGLWDAFFEIIYSQKGYSWINTVDKFTRKIVRENNLKNPKIFNSIRFDDPMLTDHPDSGRDLKLYLGNFFENLENVQKKLITCPITGLYNAEFFKYFFKNELKVYQNTMVAKNIILIFIEVDNMVNINLKFGRRMGDEVLRKMAILIKELKFENHLVFKKEGPGFYYYIEDGNVEEITQIAENFRRDIKESKRFGIDASVSISITTIQEIENEDEYVSHEELYKRFMDSNDKKMRLSKRKGGNFVTSEYFDSSDGFSIGKVLIVDNHDFNAEILKSKLENFNYEVAYARDGDEAVALIEEELPDIVLSEVLLPKTDGFLIKERLNIDSNLNKIPFLLMSHKKDEQSIIRALNLKIYHYFKKPVNIVEVIGVIRGLIDKEN